MVHTYIIVFGCITLLILITGNKNERNEKKRKVVIHSRKAPLQHNTLLKKKKGLLRRLVLDPLQGRLSRRGLEIFGALSKENRLKGLNNDDRPFDVRNWIAIYRPCSLFGRIRTLTLIGPRHLGRTTIFGEHLGGNYFRGSARAGDLNPFWSIPYLGAGGSIFPNSMGIKHALCLPQVGRGINTSLF